MSRRSRKRKKSLNRRVSLQNSRSNAGWEKMRLKDVQEVLSASPRCHYCTRWCKFQYHIDHKVPLSRGGTHQKKNLCRACPRCNMAKGVMTEEEFRNSTSFWLIGAKRKRDRGASVAATLSTVRIHEQLDAEFASRLEREA